MPQSRSVLRDLIFLTFLALVLMVPLFSAQADSVRDEAEEHAIREAVDFSQYTVSAVHSAGVVPNSCPKLKEEQSFEQKMDLQGKWNVTPYTRVGAGIVLGALVLSQMKKSCIRGPVVSLHKDLHLAGSAAITAGVMAITDDPEAGIEAAVIAGGLRELQKQESGGRCEWASMAYDAAGIFAGYEFGKKFFITHEGDGAMLHFEKRFK